MSATAFSGKIAFFTALASAVIGLCASYAIVRGKGALATVFQTLLIGPIVVPHIALAIALYLLFQTIGLTETTTGYVIAHTIIALPFCVFTIVAALSQVDPAPEDAAMCCGANRFSAFRAVTLPLIWPNVLSGALFAFVISFDEPVISFFGGCARQNPATNDVRRHRTESDADHSGYRGDANIAFHPCAGRRRRSSYASNTLSKSGVR